MSLRKFPEISRKFPEISRKFPANWSPALRKNFFFCPNFFRNFNFFIVDQLEVPQHDYSLSSAKNPPHTPIFFADDEMGIQVPDPSESEITENRGNRKKSLKTSIFAKGAVLRCTMSMPMHVCRCQQPRPRPRPRPRISGTRLETSSAQHQVVQNCPPP